MAWTGKKSNVVYTKPEEPSFLKKFKEKVGYKEDAGINDKFQKMPSASEDDLKDNDDELPQVVQLNPGDLSQDEFEKLTTSTEPSNEEDKDTGLTEDGRIMFKKPTKTKRQIEESSDVIKSSKMKKSHQRDLKITGLEKLGKQDGEKEECHKKKGKTNNKMLLSFNEDDVDEDS